MHDVENVRGPALAKTILSRAAGTSRDPHCGLPPMYGHKGSALNAGRMDSDRGGSLCVASKWLVCAGCIAPPTMSDGRAVVDLADRTSTPVSATPTGPGKQGRKKVFTFHITSSQGLGRGSASQ